MSVKTLEFLSTRRGRDEFGRLPHSELTNSGELLTSYALNGDFSIIEQMSRDFVTELYASENEPFHLRIYNTGVGYALFHLIRAWNQWHETSYNVHNTMSLMFYDRTLGQWVEHPWYGTRP